MSVAASYVQTEGESCLRLACRSRFILADSPLWATIDGVCVASGSVRNGFDQVFSISTGNHLLKIAAGPPAWASDLPPWQRAEDHWGTAGARWLLCIPEPGSYRISLSSLVHFGAGFGDAVPVLKQLRVGSPRVA